jgi:hypothetical protein
MSDDINFAAAAGLKALENVVDDIYNLGKSQFETQLKRWTSKAKIKTLYGKYRNVRLVKTIWQVEKEVDLNEFYYPSKIIINGDRKIVMQLSDIPYKGNVVIQGTVGQGKSIFFRYLTSRELFNGKIIPVFVELRRITKKKSLVKHLIEEMQTLGFELDQDTFEFLLDQGMIVFFLDGFDEVNESLRTDLITEIEHLCKRFEKTRILISSRPDSGIEQSPFFRVMRLAFLVGNEYEKVIARICDDSKTSEALISGVKSERKNIQELLTTPLMVALLVFRFKATQSIPENSIAFYSDLFNLLINRHDKSKAGYQRPRVSKLSDSNLETVFDATCFLTYQSGDSVYSKSDLIKQIRKALDVSQISADPDPVMKDICEITCLILEEGGEYRFVHKSVQEYHAAVFIKSQAEATAERFYMQCHAKKWLRWLTLLEFLKIIDSYRFDKYFFIPDLLNLLHVEHDSISQGVTITRDLLIHIFKDNLIAYDFDSQDDFSWMRVTTESWKSTELRWLDLLHNVKDLVNVDRLQELIKNGEIPLRNDYQLVLRDNDTVIELSDLIRLDVIELKDVSKLASPYLTSVHAELMMALEYVRKIESNKDLFK